jgi:hypothetical protein
MANLTDGIRLGAISSCDFTGAGRIVDVGGADGAVLAHILTGAPPPPASSSTSTSWPRPRPGWPATAWATA